MSEPGDGFKGTRGHQQILNAGRQAYEEGFDVDDCPFDIKWMQRAWRDGWIAAKDEAFDGGSAVSTSP